ncbi:hypothetical protein [Gryllotalpicola protaetiae]|uniref:Hemagglutinin n=1 Tax=Gryllotalpicola protaetiae TaxID=2419771 RepID=A0A387BTQ7_9MICO|nr:hypothetical protein [Gryllotalpicola protaetiae]AYG04450.1 hypothetical protein D7I44_13525 [Gryllotalpicola protaetiae]
MHLRRLVSRTGWASWSARAVAAAVLLVMVIALTTLTVHTAAASRADNAPHATQITGKTKLPPFQAGELISDDSFFNAQAMTTTGIQQWLLQMPCEPKDTSPCLAFFRQDTATRPANTNCGRYSGAHDESAAAIVSKVARACGISPRVLLVLVQKEQSLITRPSAYGYQLATGYACPDSGKCDEKYYGFFNQLYSAAWQFREYGNAKDHWAIAPGTAKVQYSPDASCGASAITVANQATADLYLYTPYQPDAYTRAHPDGPAGRCSAYGNLNFFRLYSVWFGDPRAVRYPEWWGPCLDNVGGIACRDGN